jgi:hypothetical protein
MVMKNCRETTSVLGTDVGELPQQLECGAAVHCAGDNVALLEEHVLDHHLHKNEGFEKTSSDSLVRHQKLIDSQVNTRLKWQPD